MAGPLTAYHDMRILKSFLDDMPIEACVEKLENDVSDYDDLVTAAKNESYARETGVDVPVMKWVEEALQERPCFYTFNHPDNKLLWLIAEGVLRQLGLPITPDAKPRQKPFLGEISAAVPRGIVRALGASWRRDLYAVDGEEIAWRDIVERFYTLYGGVANLQAIVDFNRKRSMIPLI